MLRFFPVSVNPQRRTLIFIYELLLPEGQTGRAWEPAEKQSFFAYLGALDSKVLLLFESLNSLQGF
jgi:hypothetical protein